MPEKIENNSGLKPVGRAVLVQMYEPLRSRNSVIQIPEHVQSRADTVNQRAVVVELGPSCWHDEPCARAAAGDKVLVTAMAGYIAKGPADGKLYRLVNDRDIFCVITKEVPVDELRKVQHG